MYEHCKTCTHDDGAIGWCDKCVYTIFHRKTGLPPTEYERREEPKPITNADRIRAMTDEELAELFVHLCCPYSLGGKVECNIENKGCKECWLDWLKQEAID